MCRGASFFLGPATPLPKTGGVRLRLPPVGDARERSREVLPHRDDLPAVRHRIAFPIRGAASALSCRLIQIRLFLILVVGTSTLAQGAHGDPLRSGLRAPASLRLAIKRYRMGSKLITKPVVTLRRGLTSGPPCGIWPVTFGLACCAIARCRWHRAATTPRFGREGLRGSPRQSDLISSPPPSPIWRRRCPHLRPIPAEVGISMARAHRAAACSTTTPCPGSDQVCRSTLYSRLPAAS